MSFARFELGLSLEEFWRTTPAQLSGLSSAWRDNLERKDYRSGIITAVIRRIVGDKKADWFDYFGGSKPKKEKPSGKKISENMKAFIAGQKIYGKRKAS